MFILDNKSIEKLKPIRNEMAIVVKASTLYYDGKFIVHDGLRTLEKQKQLVTSGASKTMDSRHLTGHAVDLVPLIDGKPVWDWPELYKIAEAMRTSAKKYDFQLRWGGCWDLVLNSTNVPAKLLVKEYVDRCKVAGKKAFTDGAHFELYRGQFP